MNISVSKPNKPSTIQHMKISRTSALLAAFSLIVSGGIIESARASLVPLQNATADYSQQNWGGPFDVSQSIDGILTGEAGWAVASPLVPASDGTPHTAAYQTQSNAGFASGSKLTFSLYFDHMIPDGQHTLGRFRISLTTDDRSTFADGLQIGGDVTANWTVLTPLTYSSANGATMTLLGDNSILVSGLNPVTDIYTVTVNTAITGITGFRLEALTDPSLVNNGPGRANNGNFVLTEFQVDIAAVPEPSLISLSFLAGFTYILRRKS
jgi:hypothetical protein